MTMLVGLLQSDSVVLVADRRIVYGSGAVHDNHRKLFGGNGVVAVGTAGGTDTAEACLRSVELPGEASLAAVQEMVEALRREFEVLVPESDREARAFTCLVAGAERGGVRLWDIGVHPTPRVAPCTVGLACAGAGGSLGAAVGGQLHGPDLSPGAAVGLGMLLVEMAARCYAAVGGGADSIVVRPNGDTEIGNGAGERWKGQVSTRIGGLLAPWPRNEPGDRPDT